ncbi:hypothetical protein ACFQ46_02730 [Kineococcus sp. GCM10028916]
MSLLALSSTACRSAPESGVLPEPTWDVPVLSGAWVQMAPAPLSARGDAASTVRDGQFAVAGGYVYPDPTPAPCGDGGSCAGPAPSFRDDGASWSAATGSWTPQPSLHGVDSYARGPFLEPWLGPTGFDVAQAPPPLPLTAGESGRWVGRTFVVAGWSNATEDERVRKPVAVGSFDADTGRWRVDPWPLPDAYQQELVSVWTGTQLVIIVKAIGAGCSDEQACRRVVTWSPQGGWNQVAEWAIGPAAGVDGDPGGAPEPGEAGGGSAAVDRSPGHWVGFDELLWDGRRVVGVTFGQDVVLASVAVDTAHVEELASLPGGGSTAEPVALTRGGDVLLVSDRQTALLGPDGEWAKLPAVPGPREAGRAVGLVGDVVVRWGGRVLPGAEGSADSADGWFFRLPS